MNSSGQHHQISSPGSQPLAQSPINQPQPSQQPTVISANSSCQHHSPHIPCISPSITSPTLPVQTMSPSQKFDSLAELASTAAIPTQPPRGLDGLAALATTAASAKPARRPHVHIACINCKRAHLACDNSRPCRRCVNSGKQETCIDFKHRRRGRPPAIPSNQQVEASLINFIQKTRDSNRNPDPSLLPANQILDRIETSDKNAEKRMNKAAAAALERFYLMQAATVSNSFNGVQPVVQQSQNIQAVQSFVKNNANVDPVAFQASFISEYRSPISPTIDSKPSIFHYQQTETPRLNNHGPAQIISKADSSTLATKPYIIQVEIDNFAIINAVGPFLGYTAGQGLFQTSLYRIAHELDLAKLLQFHKNAVAWKKNEGIRGSLEGITANLHLRDANSHYHFCTLNTISTREALDRGLRDSRPYSGLILKVIPFQLPAINIINTDSRGVLFSPISGPVSPSPSNLHQNFGLDDEKSYHMPSDQIEKKDFGQDNKQRSSSSFLALALN